MSDENELYFAQLAVGEMQNLAYLVGSRSTRECVIVDPAWSVDGLLDRAEADGMNVVDKIAGVQTGNRGGHQDVPVEPVTIQEVTLDD